VKLLSSCNSIVAPFSHAMICLPRLPDM
jgi:hypothetical protein